ncbi:MAG: Hpt domain-containing protein [Sneathiella sp.]
MDEKMDNNFRKYPIGDEDEFTSMSILLDSTVMLDLLKMAQNEYQTRLTNIQDGVEAKDADKIRFAAHTLKGASGSMMAPRLSYISGMIEQNSSDAKHIQRLFPDLRITGAKTILWWEKKTAHLLPAPQNENA